MPTEVAKPPRVYPFELEPNDVTRHRQAAGPWFDFGNGWYSCRPTHSRDGSHYWWVVDLVQASRGDRDDDGTIRGGESFDWVTEDFKSCFEGENDGRDD